MSAACPAMVRRAALAAAAAVAIVHARAPLHAAEDGGATRSFRYLMGTSVRVEAFGGTDAVRQQAATEAFGAIAEIDRLMSDYRDDSELADINRRAASGPVHVSAPMLAVLQAAERVSRASDGAFDITVGPLARLWGFKDRQPHVPSATELARVRPLVDHRAIVIDRREGTVRFTKPGVTLDLGGIAKGFAVEVAAGSLKRRGLSGLIDAGGNQYVVGLPPGKRSWTVGITDPAQPTQLLGAVEISAGALSTSSDASNFLIAGERRYGHILDPRTLQPSDAALSVTVLSADATIGDALSKAVFVLGPRHGLALLDAFPGTSAVVAYREVDGGVAIAVSPGAASVFRRASAGERSRP